MGLKINTAPTVEPISLSVAKAHLRIDSEDLADDIATEISIAPGDHIVAASYTLQGSAIEVSGYDVLVNLISGTNGAGGTVDVKLQESNNGAIWNDVTGAFTQVTEDNDNAVQELAYTGAYRYIRAVATIAVNTCDFGVNVIKKSGPTIEDGELNIIITAARMDCENFQNRAYITQTWELWLDEWSDNNSIRIPLPPLQSIESIKYYDTDDVEYIIAPTEYYVDTIDQFGGWVILNHNKVWPVTQLRPANGVCITFVAGYGDAGDVPANVRAAILLILGHLYEHREEVATGVTVTKIPYGAELLLTKERAF